MEKFNYIHKYTKFSFLKDDFENSGLCIDGPLPNKSILYSRLIV